MSISRRSLWRMFVGTLIVVAVYFGVRWAYGAYLFRQAQQLLSEGQASRSYELQQQAIKFNPLAANYRRQYALTNLSIATALTSGTEVTEPQKNEAAHLVQQAIREAQTATQISPNDAQNWLVLGQIYQNLIGVVNGVEQPAIDAFRQAVELEPNNSAALYGLGQVFYQTDRFTQAVEMFEQVISLEPAHADAHYYLARSLAENDNVDAATNSYEQLLQLLDPGSEDFLRVDEELQDLREI